MTFAKRTKAIWTVELNADCPYCDEYQEILTNWSEQEGYDFVQIGESKQLCTTHNNEDLICVCEKCGKDFVISETEY